MFLVIHRIFNFFLTTDWLFLLLFVQKVFKKVFIGRKSCKSSKNTDKDSLVYIFQSLPVDLIEVFVGPILAPVP